jgi:hypothetical protein
MGKTENGLCYQAPSRDSVSETVEGIRLVRPDDPGYIGSQTHLRRLSEYARGRTARRDVSVNFSGACGTCQHPLDEHPDGQSCNYCECTSYIPSGGSYTNMKGDIVVQSDMPPTGTTGEREVAINGLLRHEVCHELYTDRDTALAFFEEMKRMDAKGQGYTANQIKTMWNILEDGMIETRERHEMPSSYRFISGLNHVEPRVGKTTTIEQEAVLPAPDGYVPTDSDGNPLPIETRDGQQVVVIPPGTEISTWGPAPLNIARQVQAAIHATSIPEFEPGELHPDAQACYDECLPHIEAAITGNTADCLARAHAIHKILVDHGMVISPEEEQQIREQIKDFQVSGGTPFEAGQEGGQPGQPGQGGGGALSPQNGMPDDSGMSDQLQDELSGAGGGGQEGAQEKDGEQGQGGGEQQGGDQSQGGGEQSDQAGSSSGQGQDRDSMSGSQSSSGGSAQGSSSAHNPVTKEQMKANEASGRGSVSDQEAEQMKKDAQRQLEADRASQLASDNQKIRKNEIEANQYQFEDRSNARPQSEAIAIASRNTTPLQEEQGDFRQAGKRIAKEVERLRAETTSKTSRRMTGRLDHRKLARAVAGDPRVFERKGQGFDMDLEIDLSIDLSGSMGSEERSQSYRTAMAIAHACRQADIPLTIYGWDGYTGSASHHALKERHSDDFVGIGAIFEAGGGGTPTAEAIKFARRRLSNSRATNKISIVQTDGGANDPSAALLQTEEAKKQGIDLIGIGYQVDERTMTHQFGDKGWKSIESLDETYDVIVGIIRDAARKAAGRKRRR